MKIYVTGGAGYIGTHLISTLNTLGITAIAIDNLSKKPGQNFPFSNDFHKVDLSSPNAIVELESIFSKGTEDDIVVHLAAKKSVAESVHDPELYKMNNLGATENLLLAIEKSEIRRLIFASSAAVYGGANEVVSEDSDCNPESPYAAIKLAEEDLIRQSAQTIGLRYLILRFFNVIGAASPTMIESDGENILPVLINRARLGKPFHIFGTDYLTPDGTCIRDYISVLDIVDAIVKALTYSGDSLILNLGTEKGYSVLELLEIAHRYIKFQEISDERREGDAARLITNSKLASVTLGWAPKTPIEIAIKSALEF